MKSSILIGHLANTDLSFLKTVNNENIEQEQPPPPEVEKSIPEQNIIFSHVEPLPKVEVFKTERIEHLKKEQPQNWSNDIAELENFFSSIELPNPTRKAESMQHNN
jgi:hypothetical protein